MLLRTRHLSLCALLVLSACTDKTDDSDTGVDSDTTNEDGDTFEEYLVSGTVRGLVNGPITLEFNGSETLTVSEDGRFSFEAGLLSGDTYEVTVSSAPNSQLCTVTAGSGTATTNVDGVEVVCACDWQDGLVEVTADMPVSTVHGPGQIRYFAESNTRGFSTYPAWKQACGGVVHTVAVAGDPAPGDFGDGATVAALYQEQTPAHVNGSASAGMIVSSAGATRGFTDYVFVTARPPEWTPEPLLASTDLIDGAAIDYVDGVDDNGAGTFAAEVGVVGGRRGNGAAVLLRATADGFEELQRGELTIDGVPTCYASDPQVMPSGHVVATMYGCADRSRQIEGAAVFDETGAASLLMTVGQTVGDGIDIINLSRAFRDDAGHVYALAQTCVAADGCLRGTSYNSVLRADAVTGAVEVLTDPSMNAFDDQRIVSISEPKVSPGGVFAAVIRTVAADCDSVCVTSDRQVAMWDGDWHLVVNAGDLGASATLEDFDVNDDGDVLLWVDQIFAAALLGGAPAPLRCWSEASGLTNAMVYGDDFGAGTLRSVSDVDLGEDGHWTASVSLLDDRRGIPSVPALVAGTCP